MYVIQKVLNHNAIIVEKEKQYFLILHKGIGFSKKSNESINVHEEATIYKLDDTTSRGKSDLLVNRIDPIYIEISHEIIHLAKMKFKKFDHNILLPLSDHIAFAIERIKKGLIISNPYTDEIRLLNPEEYEIAYQSKQTIFEKTGYEINDDELGYITLHIHSAINDCEVNQGIQIALLVKESMKKVERYFNTKVDVSSIAYGRLLTHIKYMLLRLETNEKLTLDMDEFVRTNYSLAYQVAEEILTDISNLYHQTIPRIEVGYLGLHIQRIVTKQS